MFKVVVSDPATGKAYQLEVQDDAVRNLIGKRIGETFRGEIIGLNGYELLITGGTDKDGFPMRPDVHAQTRKKVLLSDGPGFRPKEKGERRRKTVHGNTISERIMQINTKLVKTGPTPLEEIFKSESGDESGGETGE